jgi:mannosyltransferase OCH1-like enzyme
MKYNKNMYMNMNINSLSKISINKNTTKDCEFNFYNKPYVLSNDISNNIPLDIYQTWFTKNLPIKMKQRVDMLKRQNPEFNYHLYDDADCREFIEKNFDRDVLFAYDSLIPGAYKADLWRLCILFINGGIYLDIKLICVNGFKLIELVDKNHFVKDRPVNSIFNSLMVSQKENVFLLKCIKQIVLNVKNKFYGKSCLSPTGPELLGANIDKYMNINIDLFHYIHGGYIIYKNRFVISTIYPEYNNEMSSLYKAIKTKKYSVLWNERNIYK